MAELQQMVALRQALSGLTAPAKMEIRLTADGLLALFEVVKLPTRLGLPTEARRQILTIRLASC